MAYEVRVDKIVKVTAKSVVCQYDGLKPTVLPFIVQGNGLSEAGYENDAVCMSSGFAKSTAKAMGVTLGEFLAEYEV